MSQALNNPTGTSHRDYGATASTSSTTTPEVSFASGFSPTEFMSLSGDVADNINSIYHSCKQLEKMAKSIPTAKDLEAQEDRAQTINTETNALVEQTTKDLQRLKGVVRHSDKQQKLQLDKMTSDFQSVLEKYVVLQKRVVNGMYQRYQKIMAAEQDEEEQSSAVSAEQKMILKQEMEEQQQNMEMMREREAHLLNMHKAILDVQYIMGQVSDQVHMQGQHIDVIEDLVERTTANVESGTDELAKAARSRQSYRRRILILLVIAVIIGLIVTGIIVGKLAS